MAEYDATNKLWGKLNEKPNFDPNESFGQMILDSLLMHRSKLAQINDDTNVQMTFDEVRLKAIRSAQNLQKMGFKPRQMMGFITKHCDDLLPIYLATIFLACPVVPFYPILSKQEIAGMLKKTKPVVMFSDAKSYGIIAEILSELKMNIKIFVFGDRINGSESVESLLVETGEEENFVPVHIDMNNDIAGIFCSSGTTGPSKGVIISYNISAYTTPRKFTSDIVIFDVHPIYWTIGSKLIMESIVNGAVRIITAKDLSADYQLQLIEKYKITALNPVPYDLISCLKHERIKTTDLSSVTSICTFGYKMPLRLVFAVKQYFRNANVTAAYGMTEMGGFAMSFLDNPKDNGGSHLSAGCQIKIIDDNGNRCGPNECGEICAKNGYKFGGYINDPEATAAALDKEGFFRTGDVGYFDGKGILHLVDRKKNILTLFYYDGTFLPEEMEEVLLNVPDIKEVCVVGISIVGDAKLPAAVVVRQPDSNLSQNDVYKIVEENFPDRCKLRCGVYFVDSLKRTHNGKLMRRDITALATDKFKSAIENDSNVSKYLLDISDEYRKLIYA